MKAVRMIVISVFSLLLLNGAELDKDLKSRLELEKLCQSYSFIPEEEAYTHIAGGFFSVFEGRVGKIFKESKTLSGESLFNQVDNSQNIGCVCMSLKKMGYNSRFNYKLEGKLTVSFSDGNKQSFSMSEIDYIDSAHKDLPFYRISFMPAAGSNHEISEAYFISCASVSSKPSLYGLLVIIREDHWPVNYYVRISGRNELDADVHLHKVIQAVSDF